MSCKCTYFIYQYISLPSGISCGFKVEILILEIQLFMQFMIDLSLGFQKEKEKSVWETLPEQGFFIASVDNLNMLQTHCAVYCSDQKQLSRDNYPVSLARPIYNIAANLHGRCY